MVSTPHLITIDAAFWVTEEYDNAISTHNEVACFLKFNIF